MTQIISNGYMDFRQFNLWQAIDTFEQNRFWDNSNPSVDGSEIPGFVGTYSAPDLFGFWTGSTQVDDATSKLLIGGNFAMDANGNAVSGNVTGLFLSASDPVEEGFFAIAGFSVDAVRFQQVASSRTGTDDVAMLKAALAGNDRITGSAFADYVFGAAGQDTITGNAGHDTLMGDAGNDQMLGGTGNDHLKGGSGADTLKGGAGADRIQGGGGRDMLYGGADTLRDVFVFVSRAESAAGASRDTVYNFAKGIDDISLAAIDANAGQSGNQVFTFSGSTARAHSVWVSNASGNATVFADVTGDRIADFSVKVMGAQSLTATDFLL